MSTSGVFLSTSGGTCSESFPHVKGASYTWRSHIRSRPCCIFNACIFQADQTSHFSRHLTGFPVMLGITSPLTSCCEPFRLESHLCSRCSRATKTHLPCTSGWCCQGKAIPEFPDHWLLTLCSGPWPSCCFAGGGNDQVNTHGKQDACNDVTIAFLIH